MPIPMTKQQFNALWAAFAMDGALHSARRMNGGGWRRMCERMAADNLLSKEPPFPITVKGIRLLHTACKRRFAENRCSLHMQELERVEAFMLKNGLKATAELCAREFPDLDQGTLPAIPPDWQDQSWAKDMCPSFRPCEKLAVFIDDAEPEMRQCPSAPRFTIREGSELQHLYSSDDWGAILAYVETYKRLALTDRAKIPTVTAAQRFALVAISEDNARHAFTSKQFPSLSRKLRAKGLIEWSKDTKTGYAVTREGRAALNA